MRWNSDTVFRILDCLLLILLFLFQNIILNFYIIQHYNHSSYPFLWFLADFFCLLGFALTLYLAATQRSRLMKKVYVDERNELRNSIKRLEGMERARGVGGGSHDYDVSDAIEISGFEYRSNSRMSRTSGSTSSHTSEYNWPENIACFSKMTQLPCAYISWIFYSIVLIAKLVTLFKSEIPQKLNPEDFFGPQMIKFVIGISALIFTLLVEAHKDTKYDPLRNSYVTGISYGIALEILDSASFLSLLIGSESGMLYSYKFENFIISLSSVNFMLPAIALYKLCASEFGRTYSVPLETLYKVLHLVLVNGSYLGVRIYFWSMFHTDTSIFIIKNIYSIMVFLRDMPQDINRLKKMFLTRMNKKKPDVSRTRTHPANSTPKKLNPILLRGSSLNNSNQSSLHKTQNSLTVNGDAGVFANGNGIRPGQTETIQITDGIKKGSHTIIYCQKPHPSDKDKSVNNVHEIVDRELGRLHHENANGDAVTPAS